MIKAIFFDIDGTLVSFKTHRIPQSTIDAIVQAKMQGIKIYISTGRPFPLINNIDGIKHLVDGYITANGAYCFVGNKVISCQPIPDEDVRTVIRWADEKDFACMVVGEKDLAMYRNNACADRIFRQMLDVHNLQTDVPIEPVLRQRILQLTPVIPKDEEERLMPLLQGCESSRWYPDFADITAKNVNKGNGLLAIAAHQGIKAEETMALGDGGNDMSIIKQAGIGVAMGNANEALKAVADYVTEPVDENGVYHALKRWVFMPR
ncbi:MULTISPECIES: Cof-type HAD-IIB family hydrolase [unclassified Bacteroides]|uniref:Cof-type HAD-IIB family hydrolase n=1 Tax=unclassified Bacteroides TaxID=2646097 RepID=UPI001951071A|nr:MULTISPECIES: Cof-type HAD-IIB family hydrolase [unclassified Bacteroides]